MNTDNSQNAQNAQNARNAATAVNTAVDPADIAGLADLADKATAKVTTWLTAARSDATRGRNTGAAKRLAAVLSDPNGLDFTVGFVDRVVRTEDRDAAAKALADLGETSPRRPSPGSTGRRSGQVPHSPRPFHRSSSPRRSPASARWSAT
jgi:RHH-type proline utilization regulon transcriptional repressor/proline dehydrogenase/delta 1-pyrroline-5-carboxylate dehydrogenase